MSDSGAVTLVQANRIVSEALFAARKAGMPPVALVGLDASGHPVALQRKDDASMLRVDIATGKAWAAACIAAGILDPVVRAQPTTHIAPRFLALGTEA